MLFFSETPASALRDFWETRSVCWESSEEYLLQPSPSLPSSSLSCSPPLHLLISYFLASLSFIISQWTPSPPLLLSPPPRPSPLPDRGQGEGSIAWAHRRACSWRSSHVTALCLIFFVLYRLTTLSHKTRPRFHLQQLAQCTYMYEHEFSPCIFCVLACVGGCLCVFSSLLPAPFLPTLVYSALLSRLFSGSLSCLTFFSLCLSFSIDSQS